MEHTIHDVVSHLSATPRVRSIILVGSYSRGDPDAYSDIDLVIVSEGFIPRSSLYSLLPAGLRVRELSLLPYPTSVFGELYSEGTLFMAHVVKEGRLLHDDGYYVALRKIPFQISRESILLQWRILKQRVKLFDDLSIYGQVFVDCLSHLYSLLKNVAIIALALRGELQFNKQTALSLFASMFPELKKDVTELCALRPFYLVWQKSVPTTPPFAPVNCRQRAEFYVARLRKVMAKVETDEIKIKN